VAGTPGSIEAFGSSLVESGDPTLMNLGAQALFYDRQAQTKQAHAASQTEAEEKRAEKTWQQRRDVKHEDDLALIAARAKNGGEGKLTPTQRANNIEIDQARESLESLGMDKEEILRLTQKAANSGRSNPDYDQTLEHVLRTATQRKVGDDPEFARIYRTYYGPAPSFSDSAEPGQLPPGVSTEEPGLISQIGDFIFGSAAPPASAAPSAPAPVEQPAPQAQEIDGPVRPMPRTADGRVHKGRLQLGLTYKDKDGMLWHWDGQTMTEVG